VLRFDYGVTNPPRLGVQLGQPGRQVRRIRVCLNGLAILINGLVSQVAAPVNTHQFLVNVGHRIVVIRGCAVYLVGSGSGRLRCLGFRGARGSLLRESGGADQQHGNKTSEFIHEKTFVLPRPWGLDAEPWWAGASIVTFTQIDKEQRELHRKGRSDNRKDRAGRDWRSSISDCLEGFPRWIGNQKCVTLVSEVSYPCKHHRQAKAISRIDNFLVTYRTARLNDGRCAGLGDFLNSVRK